MPIPTESIISAAERSARIRAESAEIEKQQQEVEQHRLERDEKSRQEDRKVEDASLQKMVLLSGEETREQLMQWIRDKRAEVPEPPKPMPLTERMRKQLEEEQECGRQAVARAQAELDANREARLKAEREDAARQGTLAPVHQPNPDVHEKFPVNKASIK